MSPEIHLTSIVSKSHILGTHVDTIEIFWGPLYKSTHRKGVLRPDWTRVNGFNVPLFGCSSAPFARIVVLRCRDNQPSDDVERNSGGGWVSNT